MRVFDNIDLEEKRTEFPKGSRVQLLWVGYGVPKIGLTGTVAKVSPSCDLTVDWDDGTRSVIVNGRDLVKKVS